MKLYYTTLEQAKRLVDAGLDTKTADMYYEQESDTLCGDWEWIAHLGESSAIQNDLFSYRQGYTKPCWSVGRLIDWIDCYLNEQHEIKLTKDGFRLETAQDVLTYNNGDLTENCVELICFLLLTQPKTSKTSPNPKVLVVVDCQYDFVNPYGSLFVKGSEDLPERIAGIMERFDGVVFTMDAHPYNHCSFKENGGQWPVHCVEHSLGASIPFNILQSTSKKTTLFLRKGCNPAEEQYGAFDDNFNRIDFNDFLRDKFDEPIDIYVCGVAGDYCVSKTLVKLPKGVNNIYVITDMCPCIDTAFDMETFAKSCGAKTVFSSQIE